MPLGNTNALAKPAVWIGLAAGSLALDFVSGPSVQFPITFVIPVMLAAGQCRPVWAYGFAVVLPLVRFSFHFSEQFGWVSVPWSLSVAVANCGIRMAVLCTVAMLSLWVVRQARALKDQVKLLQGQLPICMICKKIQAENAAWVPLESYIARQSGVVFSHCRCPDCMPAAPKDPR